MHIKLLKFLLAGACLSAIAPLASPANLCANSAGGMNCYMTITAAVAAAAPSDVIYATGVFHETVVVAKSLSFVGNGAIVDATGLSRGFFVNGMAVTGLKNVNISGFTVQNANYEGILVANASAVSISSNTVINNNRLLTGATCPGLEAFETGEAMDCGEGIHFLAVDHSIITQNTSQGNSGGILLADDTGTTHDNLVSFNTVRDNPYACGITMASHPGYPAITGSSDSPGVYHNTVYGNRSMHNGLLGGGGAGIGIFASGGGSASYGNVVVDNYLADNGHPGISLHAHAPNGVLNDNMLVGNSIVNNGADSGDAATPGPTGISIYAGGPVSGVIVADNAIQTESYDVVTHALGILNTLPASVGNVQVQFNALYGLMTGVDNLGAGSVNATQNYWSCDGGPTVAGSCSSAVGPNILSTPWLRLSIPSQPNY